MRGIIRFLSAFIFSLALLAGWVWLLNLTQAAGQSKWLSALQFDDIKQILVDDFEDGNLNNNLGGKGSCWTSNGGSSACKARLENFKGFLEMQYNVITPNSYALFSSELMGPNVSSMDTVWVTVKGKKGGEPVYVELKDCSTPPKFPKKLLNSYLPQGIITAEWSSAAIPLRDFEEITNWSCLDQINLLAHHQIKSGQGTIYVDDISFLPAQILVDDFSDVEPENQLGGTSGYWPEDGNILYDYKNQRLELTYDVTKPVEEGGYWTFLRRTNLLTRKNAVSFQVSSSKGTEDMVVELKDCNKRAPKIKVSDYIVGKIPMTTRHVAIPLAAFAQDIDWRCMELLAFNFSSHPWFDSGAGKVFIDDVMINSTLHPVPLLIDHFDDGNRWNALVAEWTSNFTKTATINTQTVADNDRHKNGYSYRINYDVQTTSSAWVSSGLWGIDVTDYTHLRFFIKGITNNEAMHLYLEDGKGHKIYKSITATNQWQEKLIPLSDFSPSGTPDKVDLKDLAVITLAFEWRPMNGTIFIDDMSFTTLQTYLPMAVKNYREQCTDTPPNCIFPYNNYEPNNFRCSAKSFSSGQTIQSYICAPTDTSDYYYLNVTNLNPINVNLTNIPAGTDYDLYLYYGDSIVARSAKASQKNESLKFTPKQPGGYYIRVYPYSGYSTQPYLLQATFDE